MSERRHRADVCVVGGGGHVGLPLALALAEQGSKVIIVDRDPVKLEGLRRGEFPFLEDGGPELLRRLLADPDPERLTLSTDPSWAASTDVIILVIDTPVDNHLNPELKYVFELIGQLRPYFRDGHVLILRSTLFPGTAEKIHESLQQAGLNVEVCFCPERIAQGRALRELHELPQIISGSSRRAVQAARRVFSVLTTNLIELEMTEAELAKLFTNSWRYIKFAAANQFYQLATEKGLDFHRIREAMMRDYPRADDFPGAGFTAGPCLFKDTMQLAAYSRQNFPLGHSAMLVNETMPDCLVDRVKRQRPLRGLRVGILGMAFKPESDDARESLAFKLRRLLRYEDAEVLCTDPYLRHPDFVPLETVLADAEIIFIGCPHREYLDLDFAGKTVIDCWGMVGSPTSVVAGV